jgi:hypothetical protein
MIEKLNKQILAKGPPGLITRKSRDTLWKFGIRGDPPVIYFSRGDPPRHRKDGFRQIIWFLTLSKIAGYNRRKGKGMPF